MTESRRAMPSYNEVFGQDGSDDDADYEGRCTTSVEIARYDQETLEKEEENEKLLTGQSSNGRQGVTYNAWAAEGEGRGKSGSAAKRKTQRPRRPSGKEQKELMHQMEEGGPRSRSPSSDSSSSVDGEKVLKLPVRKKSHFWRTCRCSFISVVVMILFVVIGFGAYRASKNTLTELQSSDSKLLSNGSSLFAPTTIVISLDGFRADFLQRDLTPTLNAFINEGISPKYMLPSFPSVTFPNHFTLVTGLYPESHGVVGNSFWDPELQEEFSYHDSAHSMQPKWWNGEPLWVTAEDQGVRTATHMWPGSEAHLGDIEPAYVDKFNGTETLDLKVQRIMELLDKPGPEEAEKHSLSDERPQLILAYVPNVDADGHLYGPNSTEIRNTIQAADTMVLSVLEGLKQRNLTDIVNVVVVSDHGMATTSTDRLIQLEELIDTSLIEHIDGWPHYGLRFHDPSIVEMIYDRLLTQTAYRDGFDVYLRDKTMPERYHFSNNDRIAPLWIIPKTGWAIVKLDEFNIEEALQNGDIYHPRGIHGYDHEHPLMRAIFVARGPAFPHQPGSKVPVFQNTEVYNIICDSIGVEPKPNNGTLRLPLQPVGLHSDDEEVEDEDNFADPPVSSFVPQISNSAWDVAAPTSASTVVDFVMPIPATLPEGPTPTSTFGDYMAHEPATDHFDPLAPTMASDMIDAATPTPASDLPLSSTAPNLTLTRPAIDDGKQLTEEEQAEADAEADWEAWFSDRYAAFREWLAGLFPDDAEDGEETAVRDGEDASG